MTDTVKVVSFWDMKPSYETNKEKRIYGYISSNDVPKDPTNPFKQLTDIKINKLKNLGRFIRHGNYTISEEYRTAIFENGKISNESPTYIADITPNESHESNQGNVKPLNAATKKRANNNAETKKARSEKLKDYFKNYQDAHVKSFEEFKKKIFNYLNSNS